MQCCLDVAETDLRHRRPRVDLQGDENFEENLIDITQHTFSGSLHSTMILLSDRLSVAFMVDFMVDFMAASIASTLPSRP